MKTINNTDTRIDPVAVLQRQEQEFRNENTFQPDWAKIMTAAEAEYELANFVFKGTGWYFGKGGDSMLVAVGPSDTDSDRRYCFFVYNRRNPTDAFNWVLNAPVREDGR